MKQPVTLIIGGSHLVTMDVAGTILEDSGIAVAGDTIVEIGNNQKLREKYPDAHFLIEKHGLVMPGLINTHTHAAMSIFRGLADDLELMDWLTNYIFPREAKLTGEMVYLGTLLSLCEMIQSGTTSFNDMYLFEADVARAADESGMRAWVGEVLYDFPSPNYGELENGFVYSENLFKTYQGHDLVSVTVNPHAVYTCSPQLLTRLNDLARDKNALLHTHLSENQSEQDACLKEYGKTPVMHLHELGLLHERLTAAHCVMINDDEISLLAETGVKVLHCQESNMKLASGTAPAVKMLQAGVSLSLGTDGSASNNDVDMFGEMNTVAKVHKVFRMDPTAMNAQKTLSAATMGGAAALGAAEKIGSLEVGKKADCIVLDLDQPHLTPMYNPISHLVYAARGSDVIHSVVNGRILMKNRTLTTLDETAILASMQKLAQEIKAMM